MPAIAGLFVGVDDYADPSIRNLRGANRDAAALHALFVDSIPTMTAARLLDADATKSEVEGACQRLLASAGPDDVVLITFSGHGTPDHRLVLHDTLSMSVDTTSVPMTWLADQFRASPARVVVLVLDCCFAGAAPARVLDGAPVARDPVDPSRLIAGRGRILISASKHDEPAWEVHGHGLLTRALMTVLSRGADTKDILECSADVMELVRAEAARTGKSQTPVFAGYVEGGLKIPALVPGARYAAEFPDRTGIRIGRRIDELAAFGLPDEILDSWRLTCSSGLNALQLEAVNEHRVLDGKSLVVVAPTGAGKTFVGELAAMKAVAEGRRAIFVMPYRALVNEKVDDFSRRYGDTIGLRIVRCTGDHSDDAPSVINGKYDVALLTFEMFLSLATSAPAMLGLVGIAVVDEAQFITDPHRGITVELLLTLLSASQREGADVQIVALSAVIGNTNDFETWLGAGVLRSDERPVPLVEGVLDRAGVFEYRDVDGAIKTTQLLPPRVIVQRSPKPSAQDVIVPLATRLVAEGETVLIFRNQRGAAQGCARYLARELGLPPAAGALAGLPTVDLSATSRELAECLSGGTAFHSANLNRDERRVVEAAFRDAREVRALAATTTLAAGINTPASTVILAEKEFLGDDGRPFTVAEYKNMVGRAGRPGFGPIGRAVLLADHAVERRALFKRYVAGEPEAVQSTFRGSDLSTWLLRLFAQVKRVRVDAVPALLAATYGGYLEVRSDPGWEARTRHELAQLVHEMIDLELLETEDDLVGLTLLGNACGRSSLAFPSCMRLVRLLRSLERAPSLEELLLLLQVLPESDAVWTPVSSKSKVEKSRPHELAARVGGALVGHLHQFAGEELVYLRRCKRVLILHDWIAGISVEEIERSFSVPFGGGIGYGDIVRFADSVRFHLRPALQIVRVMYPTDTPPEDDGDSLATRLEFGLPAAGLALLTVRASWIRGEILALLDAGIATLEELLAADTARLTSILGAERADSVSRALVL
ncbi:MAG: DEAD/DEAH box helicase [Deltaproteobacteria bacterium]|nr:DEAD/DEAH box helicase [Deltaproteobacteria bacterium]